MSIYDEMQGVARDLLSDPDFKQGTISYLQSVPGNGPADNPGKSTINTFALTGGAASGIWKKYVDMGLGLASDLQVIAPVDDRFIPDMKGSIVIDGTKYKIVTIIKKPAAGTPVVYTYIVRAGA